jgi:hypothetical protein
MSETGGKLPAPLQAVSRQSMLCGLTYLLIFFYSQVSCGTIFDFHSMTHGLINSLHEILLIIM